MTKSFPAHCRNSRGYVCDGLGSKIAELDDNNNMTTSGQYDVYGASRAGTQQGVAATSSQGYVGRLGHMDSMTFQIITRRISITREIGLLLQLHDADPRVRRSVSLLHDGLWKGLNESCKSDVTAEPESDDFDAKLLFALIDSPLSFADVSAIRNHGELLRRGRLCRDDHARTDLLRQHPNLLQKLFEFKQRRKEEIPEIWKAHNAALAEFSFRNRRVTGLLAELPGRTSSEIGEFRQKIRPDVEAQSLLLDTILSNARIFYFGIEDDGIKDDRADGPVMPDK